MIRGLWWCSLCAWALAAPLAPKTEIEAVYHKVAVAARHKFVDGMLSVQAPGFQAFAPDGQRLDLSKQRARYQELLASSVATTMTTEILDCKVRFPDAVCRVQQCLRWEQVDARTNKLVVRKLESEVTDHWRHRAGTWRILASYVTYQNLETEEADVSSASVKPPRDQRD